MNKKKVIVIGGGLGGLSAAISLASEGFPVDLFEKNDKVGGKLNVLQKDGFTFDLGPSILTLPHIFRRLFERAGKRMEDYVAIQEVMPHWRNFFEDGSTIDLTPNRPAMEKELAKLPGNEVKGFYDFLDYSKRIYELNDRGYFAKGLDNFWELLAFYGPIRSLLGFDTFRSLNGGVRRFVKDQKLIDILNYFIKYVGSSPYDSPALLNLIPHAQFGFGLWYVSGGMYNMAKGLEKLARELNINIHLNSEIAQISRNGSKVAGVVLKDGSQHSADYVVSNMEVIPAFKNLLKEDQAFIKKYEKFEPSCSGYVLHLGVKKKYSQLAHHNFFYSKDSKKHFNSIFHSKTLSQDPTIYLVAPCKSDPAQAPEGCEVIKILPHIPYLRDENPFTRADYDQYRNVVLDKLERMGLTDLRKNIVTEDEWTPADIQKRYYSNKGSIYGVVSDRWKNLGFKAPKQSRKYKNLYFVGGSVNPGGGMPMVVLSGQQVRDKILTDQSS